MYSPKIAEDLIPQLYHISKKQNKKMTTLVNEIIRDKLNEFTVDTPQPTIPQTKPDTACKNLE